MDGISTRTITTNDTTISRVYLDEDWQRVAAPIPLNAITEEDVQRYFGECVHLEACANNCARVDCTINDVYYRLEEANKKIDYLEEKISQMICRNPINKII